MSMSASASKKIAEFVGVAYRHYSASLLRRLLKKLPTKQDADDVCQEVFLRLLRIDDATLIRDPRRYVYTVATHTLAEFYAGREPAAEIVNEMTQVAGENGMEEEADREILAARLTAELRAMPAT